jgi:hypothetical protein
MFLLHFWISNVPANTETSRDNMRDIAIAFLLTIIPLHLEMIADKRLVVNVSGLSSGFLN